MICAVPRNSADEAAVRWAKHKHPLPHRPHREGVGTHQDARARSDRPITLNVRAYAVLPLVTGAFIAVSINSIRMQAQSQDAALIHVEGVVTLNDQPVTASSTAIALGDPSVVHTTNGRAIVELKGGGMLALDGRTRVRIGATGRDNFNAIEVVEGTAVLLSESSAPLVTCRSDVRPSSNGVFRFDVIPAAGGAPGTCRFRVFDGAAAVPLVSVVAPLRSGESMNLDPRCGDMIQTTTFAAGQLDDFDRWSRLQFTARH
jgi:hypothetical protein